ncbi:hypothetical protein E4P33_07100 [Kocuria rhizophila]|uniref:Integrase catalytic domain-containing protein n=1 Tax=Kocuria rhizophila TaxID=72000 RepID=A0AAX2SFP7_KOCRH|nr:hypothetical protein E4P33_07100 [Kocuria rhizophila]
MSELAADNIPVAVSLRVLKLSRHPYYRWRHQQVTTAELTEAYRANALLDAHRDDPEFGYRFLVSEAAESGEVMCERTAWRICRDNQWWSVFGKKRGKNGKRPGPPVHDDLVKRDFSADDVNELWLTDITEHWTDEGKLYLCAIKDVFSGRIVGYSMSDRMKACLAVNALDNAVSQRRDAAGCIVHSDRGSQGGFNWSSQHLDREVSDGSSSAGSRSGGATEASVPWASEVPTACRGGVLGGDRQGAIAHRGCCRGRRGASCRSAMVPPRWRHASIRSEVHANRTLPVVR